MFLQETQTAMMTSEANTAATHFQILWHSHQCCQVFTLPYFFIILFFSLFNATNKNLHLNEKFPREPYSFNCSSTNKFGSTSLWRCPRIRRYIQQIKWLAHNTHTQKCTYITHNYSLPFGPQPRTGCQHLPLLVPHQVLLTTGSQILTKLNSLPFFLSPVLTSCTT